MNFRRVVLMAALAALPVFHATAFDLSFSAGAGAGTEARNALWPDFGAAVEHKANGFDFLWDLSLRGDGAYGSAAAAYFADLTLLIERGGVAWSGEHFGFAAGKLEMTDEIESPYSLFLSGRRNAAVNVRVRYEDERFFFEDRWIALNFDSTNDAEAPSSYERWPDRSAVLKSYGVKFGGLRLGFQDLSVFTDKYYGEKGRGPLFEPEYFLIPAPGVFIQYLGIDLDAPWKKDKSLNDNAILGTFVEWKGEGMYFDAQFLIDDINMNRFYDPSDFQNPDKIAWTVGAALDTEFGRFRLDHAGATKYCFEPYGASATGNTEYGYTFYPDTVFTLGGVDEPIRPEDNYVGYLHGENNLAFRAGWSQAFGGVTVDSAAEFVLSGAKSPANPWHAHTNWEQGGEGTKLLDDPVLEKRILLSGRADWTLGALALFAEGSAGYIWNKLALTQVPTDLVAAADPRGNGIPIFAPSSESGPIGSLALGASWTFSY